MATLCTSVSTFSNMQLSGRTLAAWALLLCLFVTAELLAQHKPTRDERRTLRKVKRELAKHDSTKQEKRLNALILPAVYYTPETHLAFGLSGFMVFKTAKNDSLLKQSTVTFASVYTLNDQIILTSPFQLFFGANRYFVNGEVAFYRFPYIFSGIGNTHDGTVKENYNAYFPRFNAVVYRKIHKNWYAGAGWWYQNTIVNEWEPNGLLDQPQIPGNRGGVTSAPVISLFNDSRNNVLSPSSGRWITAKLWRNDAFSGSDFSYTQFTLDFRHYQQIFKNQVVAAQLFVDVIDGEAPFNRLSMLGGQSRMRGYQEAVFRDKQQMVLQSEWRSRVYFNHLAFRLFAAAGGIGNSTDDVLKHFRYTAGAGLRFTLNKESKMYFRIDAGFGANTYGIYINVGEAF